MTWIDIPEVAVVKLKEPSIKDYSFQGQIVMSTGSGVHQGIEHILLDNIPGACVIEKALKADDKAGVDYWAYRKQARPLAIDAKIRSLDPIEEFGKDDLALELWSVIENNVVGWTLDVSKQSDFILWLFEPTARWVLIPFPMLCAVFNQKKALWCSQHKRVVQSSDEGSWHSECVFVPRHEIWAAIYQRYGGGR
jgi:hypothetical protein